MNNILLLGGTGAMGAHLVSLLSQSVDNQIYVTTRSNHNNYGNIYYIVGNAHDANFLIPVLKKQHWTAIIDFMVYSTIEFSQLVDIFLNSTDQYVYLSSSRVYAQSESPIKEDSLRLLDAIHDNVYLNTDEYALAKARQENILIKSDKTNWTIVRPYITYSENRLQFGVLEKESWLYRALKGRTIVIPKNILEKHTTLTYGRDVAQSITALIGNPEAYNEAFHITVGETHTWKEILNIYIDAIERYTGKNVKIHLLDKNPYQRGDKSFYQMIYDRYYNRIFDNSKIGKFININSFTPTLDGLRKCIDSFLITQKFRNINWKDEARRDRITSEYPQINEFPNIKTILRYYVNRFM